MTPERKAFAGIRPLPPFGRVIKCLVEALQLNDPASYDGNPPSPATLETLRIDGTSLRYTHGDLVKEDTKHALLAAVAEACRRLPWLPLSEVPASGDELLAGLAQAYEHSSDLLANIQLDAELFPRNVARFLTVDLAVRAGALDVLDGRHLLREFDCPHPAWASDSAAKKWIGDQVARAHLKRDDFAKALGTAESPLDRILGKGPAIPPAAVIQRMGAVLDARAPVPHGLDHVTQFRRHYAALYLRRELRKESHIEHEFFAELLSAFARVRSAVRSFAQSLTIGDTPFPRMAFVHLFTTAGRHEVHQSFWAFLLQSEGPSEWTDLYLAQARGTFVAWNEHRHAHYAAFREATAAAQQGPAALDALANPQTRAAVFRTIPLIDAAAVLELGGDHAGALEKLRQASVIAPEIPSIWHSLGKASGRAGNWDESEAALRKSLELGAQSPDVIGDLAATLTYRKRPDEAAALLERFHLSPQSSPMLAWTWSLVELRRGHAATALAHAKSAADAGFKPGHASHIAAEAARLLGRPEEARENEKRARELGWTQTDTPVFQD